MKTGRLQIRTPEGIVFAQPLAGPVTRFLAFFLDQLCIQSVVVVLGWVAIMLGLFNPDWAQAALVLGYFVAGIGYGIFLEWNWRGQTVGKRLFRLRVVDAGGRRMQFSQIVIRNLLRSVDSLPLAYFTGGLACWLTPHCQRLGDLAANTVVVRAPKLAEPDLDQLLAGKFNSLRQFPHLAARLRQNVSPAEAATALQALLRRDEFDELARVELFGALAAHFRVKVGFPPEATDGVADEQYVRNVVYVVYRSQTGVSPVL